MTATRDCNWNFETRDRTLVTALLPCPDMLSSSIGNHPSNSPPPVLRTPLGDLAVGLSVALEIPNVNSLNAGSVGSMIAAEMCEEKVLDDHEDEEGDAERVERMQEVEVGLEEDGRKEEGSEKVGNHEVDEMEEKVEKVDGVGDEQKRQEEYEEKVRDEVKEAAETKGGEETKEEVEGRNMYNEEVHEKRKKKQRKKNKNKNKKTEEVDEKLKEAEQKIEEHEEKDGVGEVRWEDKSREVTEGGAKGEAHERKANAGVLIEVPCYTQRPNAPDCSFYMKTGICAYTHNCKFNHPPERRGQKFKSATEAHEAIWVEKDGVNEVGWQDKWKEGMEGGARAEVHEQQENEELIKEPCYPQRSNAPDCGFYMKTGSCAYKHNCKFNHPPERRGQKTISNSPRKTNGNIVKAEKIQCKYYMTPNGCKYGSFCKYGHHQEETGSGSVELNFMGLPIRRGEKECPFYMRAGSCKHSTSCRFHHPDPTEADEPAVYMPDMSSPHQKLQKKHDQNEDQCVTELPLRAGVPNCLYYMRNGTCGNVTCKFNHSSNRGSNSQQCPLSPVGLPLRPGQTVCAYYARHGICKFGPACIYDHPIKSDF